MSDYFGSLEAVGEEFKKADDIENESLFVKGHIVKRAIEQGFSIDETIGYCAAMTTQDKRTVYRYYSVARTFKHRMFGLRHEMHAIASDTIDYRKDMTPDELQQAQKNALEWLKIASKEQYSTRALRAAIKATGGRVDVKPLVLLDGVQCTIKDLWFDSLTIKFDHSLPQEVLDLMGEAVKITLVQSPPVVEKETVS